MLFAAGLGTRLRPLTNDRPKALVEVKGKPLLQWAIERLVAAGSREVIVNVHHYADMIEAFIKSIHFYWPPPVISLTRFTISFASF